MLLTVVEPRKLGKTFLGDPLESSKFTSPRTRSLNSSDDDDFAAHQDWMKPRPSSPVSRTAQKREEREGMMASVKSLLTSRAFQVRWSCLVAPSLSRVHHLVTDPRLNAPAQEGELTRVGACGCALCPHFQQSALPPLWSSTSATQHQPLMAHPCSFVGPGLMEHATAVSCASMSGHEYKPMCRL